jgi:nicotinamidase/pyrazinamidase
VPANRALLIVDVQNDFCPGGALAVPRGDEVVPVLNAVIDRVSSEGGAVYASRDWHPEVSTHFAKYGGTWPVHCVAGTRGAEFHPALRLPASVLVITKGNESGADGYSAFEGRTAAGTTFGDELRNRGVDELIVGGLATDYCVRASVVDARRAGLDVTVLADAIRAVAVNPGDEAKAIADMKAVGARVATLAEAFRTVN